MTRRLTYDESVHPYMASKHPHSQFFIRTPEAKAYRVQHGRGMELLKRLPDNHPIFGVEVGVNEGYLSQHLLQERLNLTLWMVDTWKGNRNLTAFGFARCQTKFANDRRVIFRRASVEAAQFIPDGVMDFVFVDAGHSYEDVVADIKAWQPKLREGGLLCGHDIHMDGVRKAADELAPGWTTGEDAVWFAPQNGSDKP